MMKSFDEGDQAKFISNWNIYMGKGKSEDVFTNKIEFYVRIYFTIFPIHSLNKGKSSDKVIKQRQKEFKKYLDTKGSELSKTSEFLPYYALPYVPNPTEHPSFKQLFSIEWINNLRDKLLKFLTSNISSNDDTELSRIFEKGTKGPSEGVDLEQEGLNEELVEQINLLQQKCEEVENREHHTKIIFVTSQQKWSNFSRNILVIAKQLMTVIDNSDLKEGVNTIVYKSMKEKVQKYEKILQDIMKGQSQVEKPSPIRSYQREGVAGTPSGVNHGAAVSPAANSVHQSPIASVQGQQVDQRNSPSIISREVSYIEDTSISREPRTVPVQVALAPLDYDKIKKFLTESEDELKICATLQALRWRVFKSTPSSRRAEVLHTYWHYDILGILNTEEDMLIYLLNKSRRILAYTVSLVNQMASEPAGRNYLIKHPKVLDYLFAVLLNERSETAIRQQAIVAIQKFSLRNQCQNKMIEMDMIKYIVFILKHELYNLGDFTLEYSTALLMNLSLRKRGKDKCEDPNLELLHVLNELLEHENDQVRTYVNGTLYSIFRRKSLRIIAKELGMDEILTYLSQNMQPNEDHIKRQILYILDQLSKGDDEEADSSDEESDLEAEEDDEEPELEGEEDEFEALEEEGDFDDTINGVLVGEEWLMSEFLAANEEALRQTTTIKTKILEDKKKGGFDSTNKSLISEIKRSHSRPVTPTKSVNNIPFIEDTYMKSPMRTRSKIPRTPINGKTAEEGNDFKNDDNSQLDISIGASQNLGGVLAPNFGGTEETQEMVTKPKIKQKEREEEVKEQKMVIEPSQKTQEAFCSKDRIPRTPPHLQSKKYEVAPGSKETKPKSRKGK